ncbi:hypothetical protein B566_EDAN017101 [Ephemera danica]|nr:hypothetical protein B566_EDAN017101 [Ephemera danica]
MLNSIQSAESYNIPQQLKLVELILQRDYSLLNKQREDGTTPLLFACKNGKAEFANFLLSHPDCVVNFEDTKEKNSLHYAAENGCTEALKIILGRDRTLLNKQDRNATNLKIEAANFLLSYEDCSVYIQDEEKKFAIHYAAENSSEIFLNLLLNRDLTLLNKQDINGMTPLHIACKVGNDEAANFLLSYKDCSVHLQDQTNKCAIHYAAETRSFVEILQHMVKRDHTLLNKQDKNGMTPLHIACKEGNVKAANFLLSNEDCSVQIQNEKKRFAIHYAAENLNVKILKHMLERDHTLLNKKDENDMTPLHYSIIHYNGGATKFLLSLTECEVIADWESIGPSCMKILMEKNPQLLDMQNKNRQTALHIAAKKNNYDVLNFLLNLTDCNVCVKDENGDTALHLYTTNIVPFVFPHQAIYSSLNMQNNSGQTPLHMAVQTGNSNIVRYLIYLGADTELKDKNGNTPLDLAQKSGTMNVTTTTGLSTVRWETVDEGLELRCANKQKHETIGSGTCLRGEMSNVLLPICSVEPQVPEPPVPEPPPRVHDGHGYLLVKKPYQYDVVQEPRPMFHWINPLGRVDAEGYQVPTCFKKNRDYRDFSAGGLVG